MKNTEILLNGITAKELKSEIFQGVKELIEKYSKQNFDQTKYLSRKETADLLKVDISTLHNWHKQGILKPKQIGRRIYYQLSDIKEAML